jgi:hypothetical protein
VKRNEVLSVKGQDGSPFFRRDCDYCRVQMSAALGFLNGYDVMSQFSKDCNDSEVKVFVSVEARHGDYASSF